MNKAPRILVAGIGNIFLGDDAFGSEVARRLRARPQAPNVRVVDFGIRGLDLTYALLDGCDAAILIDAAPRREAPPGTLYVLEIPTGGKSSGIAAGGPAIEAHSMDPFRVLRTVESLGGKCGRVLLVGCEPTPPAADASPEEMVMEMTPPVRAAVEEAVGLVESLVGKLTYSDETRIIDPRSPKEESSAAQQENRPW